MGVRHKKVLNFGTQDPADNRVQKNGWNDDHIYVAMAEPADGDVEENTAYPWMSNGTGYGNAGDICIKINSGGTIKTATLVPFSLIS